MVIVDTGGDALTTTYHGGRIYEFADRHSVAWSQVEDFSANINPLGPPESVMQTLIQSLQQIRHYPDHRHTMVKKVLAQRFSVAEEQILCGNGATEVIDLWLEALRPTRLAILTPAFQGYESAAHRWGIPLLKLPMMQGDALEFPVPSMLAKLRPGDGLIVNNPHNPTGFAIRAKELSAMIDQLEDRQVHVMVDESFIDFLHDQEEWSVLKRTHESRYLYVLRSATKMYAIPGLRFGFAVGNPEVLARVEKKRDGWSVNQLAQLAAATAYQDREYDQLTWTWLEEEKRWLRQTWGNQASIHLYTPSANFFLVRFPSADKALELSKHLAESRVYLRGMDGFFPLDDRFVRVAIRTRDKNESLWQWATDFLALNFLQKD